MVLRDSLGETAHLRYRTNGRDSGKNRVFMGLLYIMCPQRGGTPLQMGYEWHWRGVYMVLF